MFKIKTLVFISLIFLLFVTSNCTLIGYGIGSAIDANKSGEHFTITEELFEINPETEL